MRAFRITWLLLVAVLAASTAFAQGVRGNGRISGKVVDEAGKGIAGVEIRAQKVGESQVLTAKTNDKGEWALGGLAGGQWNVDFVKEGLETVQEAVTVSESGRLPPRTVTMKKAEVKEDPSVVANRELQRAEQLVQSGKVADARKIYEDLLAKYPNVYQLHINLGRVHAIEGNKEKANEHFKLALEQVRAEYDKDPKNPQNQTVMAFLLQNLGQGEEAAKILVQMDVSGVKDPVLFINAAITMINGGKAAEAVELLNKLVTAFPNEPLLLYYRGRAYLAASKFDEAKADLEKFVAANPQQADAELAEAKKLIDQLAKIKK
jgi:tetratricopeptide (TPR) repeat protein